MSRTDSRIRAFLSIDIDDEALVTRVHNIQQQIDVQAAKIKMVEPQNIHFTLRFLGDTSISKIERIHEQLKKVTFTPFDIRIETVGAFPSIKRPRVVWIGVTENQAIMKQLKEKIDDRLGELSYPPEPRFKPHATIARVRAVHDRKRVIDNLEGLSTKSIGTMTVTSFRMKKSTLTPSGPIYETLWEIEAS